MLAACSTSGRKRASDTIKKICLILYDIWLESGLDEHAHCPYCRVRNESNLLHAKCHTLSHAHGRSLCYVRANFCTCTLICSDVAYAATAHVCGLMAEFRLEFHHNGICVELLASVVQPICYERIASVNIISVWYHPYNLTELHQVSVTIPNHSARTLLIRAFFASRFRYVFQGDKRIYV